MGKTLLVENAGLIAALVCFSIRARELLVLLYLDLFALIFSALSIIFCVCQWMSGETLDAALDGLLGKQLRKSGTSAAAAAAAAAAAVALLPLTSLQ